MIFGYKYIELQFLGLKSENFIEIFIGFALVVWDAWRINIFYTYVLFFKFRYYFILFYLHLYKMCLQAVVGSIPF